MTVPNSGSDERRVEVFVDDELVASIDEGAEWFGDGTSGEVYGASMLGGTRRSKSFPVDVKVVLYNRQNNDRGGTPRRLRDTHDGVLLWIED